ncbi:MAG: hypothetical protein Q9160_000662 [Pyrenula sp. 1 TL-2023]
MAEARGIQTNHRKSAGSKKNKSINNTTAEGLLPGQFESGQGANTANDVENTASKPKRVRTGCLTCRQRHLKCDEEQPICVNCRRSNRTCERGVRLNYIDTQTNAPPYLVPPSHDWHVTFQDESREIAAEYKGGAAKYGPVSRDEYTQISNDTGYDAYGMGAPQFAHQPLPSIGGMLPAYPEAPPATYAEPSNGSYQPSYNQPSTSTFSESSLPRRAYDDPVDEADDSCQPFLTDADEVFYMQVFVEEVGLWMDSMDPENHFSRILPFQALQQPMLKQAFLACGARHLTLVNAAYPDEKALDYYNNATQMLLRSLQNPERDSVLCGVTAVILNVYETMSERALQRMNHIAGARALIKECGWNAKSTGIGGACFWLNVGMEIHSCLHFNWLVAWEPDEWGMDMTMDPERHSGHGIEEHWTHKMLYILARVANFRASIPKFQEKSIQAEQLRLQHRVQMWNSLKGMLDRWHECVPPNMHPMAQIPPRRDSSTSLFPEIWIIKRTAKVALLFYHTAMALLGASHPMQAMDDGVSNRMEDMKLTASQMICGIVLFAKDRGVASASVRCLAIAGEFLIDRREQQAVLEMFAKIKKETGWKINFLHSELIDKWGWNNNPPPADLSAGALNYMANGTNGVTAPSAGPSAFFPSGNGGMATMPPVPSQPRKRPPAGIVNPLYRNASFEQPDHPYPQHYVAPAPNHLLHNNGLYSYTT